MIFFQKNLENKAEAGAAISVGPGKPTTAKPG